MLERIDGLGTKPNHPSERLKQKRPFGKTRLNGRNAVNTIYRPLPVVKRVVSSPLLFYSSTNQWEFGTSMMATLGIGETIALLT